MFSWIATATSVPVAGALKFAAPSFISTQADHWRRIASRFRFGRPAPARETAAAAPAPWSEWRELRGSFETLGQGVTVGEAINPEEIIEVLVCVRPSSDQGQSARGPQFADMLDMGAISAFASHFGLKISDIMAPGGLVILKGAVVAFEAAFRVELRCHHLPNSRTCRGRVGPVWLPAELDGIVVGVFGLDDRPMPWRPRRKRPAADSESGVTTH